MITNILTSPITSLFIVVLGTQFFQSFVTVALDADGYTEFYIGIVHSASYLGLLVAAIYSESIIKRIGHIRNFCLASSLMALSIIVQSFDTNFYLWVICRFASGIALASLIVTIESWLMAESSVENRGKNLAIYMIAYYFSQSLSPQIFHFIDLSTLMPFLVATMLCILSNVPVTLTYKSNPEIPETAHLKIVEVYKINSYGFIGCFVSGIIISALYSFMPKYIYEYNLSLPWMMSALICGGSVLQWPLGKISDMFNREMVITILTAACIVPLLLIIYLPYSSAAYAFIFIIGGLSFALYPISISAVCDLVQNKCIIKTTGVLLFSYALGSVFGPILVSLYIDYTNSTIALFKFIVVTICVYCILGVAHLLRNRNQILPSDAESVNFIPMPKNSSVGIQLDPRQELTEQEGDLRAAIKEDGATDDTPIQVEE